MVSGTKLRERADNPADGGAFLEHVAVGPTTRSCRSVQIRSSDHAVASSARSGAAISRVADVIRDEFVRRALEA